MCLPVRAHGRHMANTIELVLPSAHPSPQCKWQIDPFSHFCTAHGRVSSGMPEHVLSPNCPFALRIWTPSNSYFLGPILVHKPNGISMSSVVFAQITTECRCTLQRTAPHGSGPHLTHDSWSPSEPITQTASPSVQPFLQGSLA